MLFLTRNYHMYHIAMISFHTLSFTRSFSMIFSDSPPSLCLSIWGKRNCMCLERWEGHSLQVVITCTGPRNLDRDFIGLSGSTRGVGGGGLRDPGAVFLSSLGQAAEPSPQMAAMFRARFLLSTEGALWHS